MIIFTVDYTPEVTIVLISSWIITCLVMFVKDRIENYKYKKKEKEWEEKWKKKK